MGSWFKFFLFYFLLIQICKISHAEEDWMDSVYEHQFPSFATDCEWTILTFQNSICFDLNR